MGEGRGKSPSRGSIENSLTCQRGSASCELRKKEHFIKIDIGENLEILVGHYDKAICPASWLKFFFLPLL